MSDPETKYAEARAMVLLRRREYNEAQSRLIEAEREMERARVGTAYANAVAAIWRMQDYAQPK